MAGKSNKQDPEEDPNENPSEYWAGFSYQITTNDLLVFFVCRAEEKGISLELKVSVEAKERFGSKICPNIGALGYQIDKSIDSYVQQKLNAPKMLEQFLKEYIVAPQVNEPAKT